MQKPIIDYILVKSDNRWEIIDTSVRRGLETGNDYYVVVTKYWEKMEKKDAIQKKIENRIV